MMNSKATLISVLALFISLAANANDARVEKTDGSLASYKLLPVHHDPSHAQVVEARLQKRATAGDVPAEYQIPKDKLPDIRDQGQRGTCVYFATIGMLETNLISHNPANKSVRLSEQCLVGVRNWEADHKEYTGDDRPTNYRPDPDGDELDLVAKSVGYFGVAEAKNYSSMNCTYDGFGESKATPIDDYTSLFKTGQSIAHGKGNNFQVDRAPTAEKIKALIAQNIPVEIATLVYNEHFDTSTWAYHPAVDTDNSLAGGHAIILTGYRQSGDRTLFTFKNSWGTTWGNSGFGAIDSNLLEQSWKYAIDYDLIVSYHE